MKLKDKVVLITGGGSGLGRETGLTFAREGAKVGINDVRPESAQNVVTEIERAGGKGAKAFVADVSNSAAVKKMFADFIAAYGTIDILINNAGIGRIRENRQRRGGHAGPDRRRLAQDARDASRLDVLLHPRGAQDDDPEKERTHHQSRVDRGDHRPRVRAALLRGQGRHRVVHQIGRARGGRPRHPRQCDRARIYRDADDGADRGGVRSRSSR